MISLPKLKQAHMFINIIGNKESHVVDSVQEFEYASLYASAYVLISRP
jgi:hypothetical protein